MNKNESVVSRVFGITAIGIVIILTVIVRGYYNRIDASPEICFFYNGVNYTNNLEKTTNTKKVFNWNENVKNAILVELYHLANDEEMYDGVLFDRSGVFVSTVPIEIYSLYENKVETVAYYVFSENKDLLGYLLVYKGTITNEVLASFEKERQLLDIIEYADVLSEREHEYIRLGNILYELKLDNTIEAVSNYSHKDVINIEVKGNAYEKLKEKGLSTDFNEIINKKNWSWFEF